MWAERKAAPVSADGDPILKSVFSADVDPNDVRYQWREGHFLWGGLIGWGRLNRRRYIQILWIPIPIGESVPSDSN